VQPGERITLIKKIAARLAPEGLEEIRLTLRQFGTSISWYHPDPDSIDPFQSIVFAIEDEGDETLVALHDYLFGGPPSPVVRPQTDAIASEIWAPGSLRLFISHTSAHKEQIGMLRDGLKLVGISGFVAHTDIHPTRAWQDVIESALETCDALAAYMTLDFHTSLWTDQEVGFCVGRAILILPLKAGLDPYGFIGKYQALNALGKTPLVLAGEIADIAIDHALTASRMAAPTAEIFAHSYSYDNARENLLRLMRIPKSEWTPEMVQLVGDALGENSQLRDGVAPTASGPREIPEAVREMFAALPLP
jgi:hypothetical protein